MTKPMNKEAKKLDINPRADLHPRQQQAYFTPANEVLYGGSAGGGKSHLMRHLAVSSCVMVPGLQVYLFRRTAPDLHANHMDGPSGLPAMIEPLLSTKQAKINYSKGCVEFWNGSKIHLCHAQYEKDKFKYLGAEIHLLLIDELTTFPREIYTFLRGRCRLGGLQLPEQLKGVFPRIVCGSNPGGIGHNWVKATFIDPKPPEEVWQTPDHEGGMMRQFIPAKLTDNPTLTENDPDYKRRLEGLDNPALVRAMLDGDWNIVSGGAIDDLWHHDIHVIKAFNIPRNWYLDRSFDWGSSKPFSVCWFAESNGEEVQLPDGSTKNWPRGTLFMIGEWYGWNGRPDEGCKMLASEIASGVIERDNAIVGNDGRPLGLHPEMPHQTRWIRSGPADSSIFDVQNGMCIAGDMAKKGVRWNRADKRPGSRKNGLELVRTRLKASLQYPQEEAGLFFFDTCVHAIRCIPVLPRSENDTEDVDTKAEDHNWDALRYRVLQRKMETTTQEL